MATNNMQDITWHHTYGTCTLHDCTVIYMYIPQVCDNNCYLLFGEDGESDEMHNVPLLSISSK